MSTALIVALAIFVLIFVLRMPIALGMIVASVAYLLLSGGDLSMVPNQMMHMLYTTYVVIAVPLFIFTANIMNSGKITEMIFKFANGLVGGVRGALGHVNVLSSLIFSGMTGSAIADAAGLGKMEIDSMRKAGYDDGFSCAITAASATIGPIFPPSIPLVIYAMFSGASVGALFMGGMVPAVLLALMLMVYIAVVSKRRDYPREARSSLRDFLFYTLHALPSLLTPVILLGGIYTGVMTPTEAGAVAGLYALIVSALVYKALGWKEFLSIVKNSVRDTGTTSIMIGAAAVISYIVAREQLAQVLAQWIVSISDDKYLFLLLVNIIILVLGMFIDTNTIQLIFVPIMIPVARALGIDIVHFGLVVTFNMMVGLSTPPFGMLLFITSGVSGTPLKDVVREVLPPVFVMILALILITYFPEIVLFLPKATGLM